MLGLDFNDAGYNGGIFMASTVSGSTRVWNKQVLDPVCTVMTALSR